jgi:hypothetical protein
MKTISNDTNVSFYTSEKMMPDNVTKAGLFEHLRNAISVVDNGIYRIGIIVQNHEKTWNDIENVPIIIEKGMPTYDGMLWEVVPDSEKLNKGELL